YKEAIVWGPKIITGERERVKETTKEKARQRQRERQRAITGVKPILREKEKEKERIMQMSFEGFIQAPKERQRLRQRQRLIQRERIITEPPPTMKFDVPPPPGIPGGFFFLPERGRKGKKIIKGRKPKERRGYLPSFTAVMLGLTTRKKPKKGIIYTGGELRRIYIGGRRKKPKKKKRR
ncbi:hypothetical protein KKE60_04930, partial [Patescibacteria group bacterium]|nr:hypothetical protein [Patescibacteria group bacterium]